MTWTLTIRNDDTGEVREITSANPDYSAAKIEQDAQVPEGWTKLHYWDKS